jgi:hypothetical protein
VTEINQRVDIAKEAFTVIAKEVDHDAKNVKGNDSVIVMLDHGFTTYKHCFYIND